MDNLPARILRTCAKKLSIPLAHLFNLSLRTGKMPTLWKSANITPIHKGASWELVTNYRSISLLPIPAKCLERIVHCAIYDHVSPFLTEWQHGFIKGRSCETQLILTHHQWATALDKGRQVDVVFLDFSKAFDEVNHAVLLQMLCNFGITGSLLLWCESYLSNRRQKVVLDGISLFLVRCLIWSSSGLFIRAFIFLYLHLLLFITRKYAITCVKRRPILRRYIH